LPASNDSATAVRVRVNIEERHGTPRRGEPIAVGVPLPSGALRDASSAAVVDAADQSIPSQHQVLARWPDGSIRWLLTELHATVAARERTSVFLQARSLSKPADHGAAPAGDAAIEVLAGACRFAVPRHGAELLSARRSTSGASAADSVTLRLQAVDGTQYQAMVESAELESAGPVRVTVNASGGFGRSTPLRFRSRLTVFRDSALLKLEVTLHNPNAARHVGNVWDLGDPGSCLFEDLTLQIRPAAASRAMRWRTAPESPWQSSTDASWLLYQDSSGGEHWDSANHIDASSQPTVTFRGYHARAADEVLETGQRAQPVVVAEAEAGWLAAAVECFWQNFPKSLRFGDVGLGIGLFPRECRAPFELQGGEEKRHTIWLQFGEPGQPADLTVAHQPLACWVEREDVAASAAVPYLGPSLHEADAPYADYIGSIVGGPRSFSECREVIDEYGWRHFGDVYADHEAVGWSGPKPLISHYNNQYDFLHAAAMNFLRTADYRWRELCFDGARHMIDIDIYHTDRDRAAYNGGLFWHTDHYRDAATCTHRSYSRRNGSGSAYGGGPANEHNYTSGLLLYYYISGDPEARRAVLGLANWALALDDGGQTIFALITDRPTGGASQTRSTDYHKAGRGAGNSINALLDAYRLSGNRQYLAKAEELICRCIHPQDDVGALRFDDPENRWSYLAFLQVLGKYLDLKVEYGEPDYYFYFARDSLLHYANWMRQNEVPYRDVLHKVEIPTETWSAQDVRKAHVFHVAAKCSNGARRTAFAERAAFFSRRCMEDLLSFETPYLTRPRVLIAGYEPALTFFARHGYGAEDGPHARAHGHAFGLPEEFVPQRQLVRRALAAKALVVRREVGRLLREKWAQLSARFRSRPRSHQIG
jgi:hypothetical protein